MKNFLERGIWCLIIMLGLSVRLNAQQPNSKEVPFNLTLTFKKQYPLVMLKSWIVRKDQYIGKFKYNRQTNYAFYNLQGVWEKTETKMNWPWRLPEQVKKGMSNSLHGDWHEYEMSHVSTPDGEFYRIEVDNSNHPIDAQHQLVLMQYWEICVTRTGKLIAENELTNPLLAF